jgi:hypothetical protein
MSIFSRGLKIAGILTAQFSGFPGTPFFWEGGCNADKGIRALFLAEPGKPDKKIYYPSSHTLTEYVQFHQTGYREYRREPADLQEVLHDMPELQASFP